MMRVWITRSEPGASQLGSYLAKFGFTTVVAPVVTIQAIQNEQPLGVFDCWVFVSSHAVESALTMGWTSSGTCIAVGPATEESLSDSTSSILVPDQHSSEGLYKLLVNKLSPKSRICLVSGSNGRRDLEEWLTKDGFGVVRWVVYRRSHLPVQVNADELDAVVVSSAFALPEVLNTFQNQRLSTHDYPSLVVASNRISDRAKQLGFLNVSVSDGASNSEVLNTLMGLN